MKLAKNRQYTVRLMAPFNMRCATCGEYIYKGKKFNARKEDVENEDYLGIRIYRFYIKVWFIFLYLAHVLVSNIIASCNLRVISYTWCALWEYRPLPNVLTISNNWLINKKNDIATKLQLYVTLKLKHKLVVNYQDITPQEPLPTGLSENHWGRLLFMTQIMLN